MRPKVFPLRTHPHIHDPLLARDDGKVRIGRETVVGRPAFPQVERNVGPVARLLARADDQPHIARRRDSRLLCRIHSIERLNQRTLVVLDPATVQDSIFNLTLVGAVLPSPHRRHHVDVSRNPHRGAFLAITRCGDGPFDFRHLAFPFAIGEPHRLRALLQPTQAGGNLRLVLCLLLRSAAGNRLKTNDANGVPNQVIRMGVQNLGKAVANIIGCLGGHLVVVHPSNCGAWSEPDPSGDAKCFFADGKIRRKSTPVENSMLGEKLHVRQFCKMRVLRPHRCTVMARRRQNNTVGHGKPMGLGKVCRLHCQTCLQWNNNPSAHCLAKFFEEFGIARPRQEEPLNFIDTDCGNHQLRLSIAGANSPAFASSSKYSIHPLESTTITVRDQVHARNCLQSPNPRTSRDTVASDSLPVEGRPPRVRLRCKRDHPVPNEAPPESLPELGSDSPLRLRPCSFEGLELR